MKTYGTGVKYDSANWIYLIQNRIQW